MSNTHLSIEEQDKLYIEQLIHFFQERLTIELATNNAIWLSHLLDVIMRCPLSLFNLTVKDIDSLFNNKEIGNSNFDEYSLLVIKAGGIINFTRLKTLMKNLMDNVMQGRLNLVYHNVDNFSYDELLMLFLKIYYSDITSVINTLSVNKKGK